METTFASPARIRRRLGYSECQNELPMMHQSCGISQNENSIQPGTHTWKVQQQADKPLQQKYYL